MLNTKTLVVSAIQNGTVIDHIPSGKALQIIQLLKLSDHQKQITLALHLVSGSMGHKDIVKLEECFLSNEDREKVAILAPNATLNVIQDCEVTEKTQVVLPNEINGVISCPNDRCISNHESMSSKFNVEEYRKNIRFRCRYCRKYFSQEDVIT